MNEISEKNISKLLNSIKGDIPEEVYLYCENHKISHSILKRKKNCFKNYEFINRL